MTHFDHNDEFIDPEEYQQLTKEDYRLIAVGSFILIFLFFITIGFIVSWGPFDYTAGMFTFFWVYQLAVWLSNKISSEENTLITAIKVLAYIVALIVMCGSMMYEILVLFGQ